MRGLPGITMIELLVTAPGPIAFGTSVLAYVVQLVVSGVAGWTLTLRLYVKVAPPGGAAFKTNTW
jgi:hypothetical protein